MNGRGIDSVKGLLALTTRTMLGVALVGGLLAALGAYQGLTAVRTIADEVQPAALANGAVLQHMTDAETSVRAWSQSGDPSALEPYKRALTLLPFDHSELRIHARHLDSPELLDLVKEQEGAAQAWFDDYATERAGAPGGPGTYSDLRFITGKSRFDAVRKAHAGVDDEIDSIAERTRAAAIRGLVSVLGATVILLAGAIALAVNLRRRNDRQIRRPLRELTEVVRRQAEGDHATRAPMTGAWEVRQVAAALNEAAGQT